MAKNKISPQKGLNISGATDGVVISRSAAQTRALGKALARRLKAGDTVFIEGEVGSGKTTLVQGIARGMGVMGAVRSSSFILVNEYPTKENVPLFHVDLYRLHGGDISMLGLDDYRYASGIMLIEWPCLLRRAGRRPSMEIRMKWKSDNERIIEIK